MNKIHFFYKYYLEIPLKREIYLLNTARKIQKIIKKLIKYKDIPDLSKKFTQGHDINIHILCSHHNLECLLLSLASFYAFSKEYAEVVLHEDGTFAKRDITVVKTIFPWIKYISLEDADEQLKQKGFSKKTIKLRHEHKLLIKTIDFHHIDSEERILIIDTDIFVLEDMRELWDKVIEGRQFAFVNDPEPAYGSSKDLLEKILGRKLTMNFGQCVNTGLIIEPAGMLRKEKAIIESYCREFENFSFQRKHCIEQGYVACILKDKGVDGYTFSNRYKIIGHKDMSGFEWLKKYDFINNPDSLEAIHLCGWDKFGKDFQIMKKKILKIVAEKVK